MFTHQRQSQVSSETGGNDVVGVSTSTEIDVTEEGFVVLHATDDHVDPKRLEFRTAVVEDARQPGVEILGLEGDFVVKREVGEDCLVDELLKELEVSVVSADAHDNVLVDVENTVDVVVAGEISIGHEQVTGDNDALVVFDADNRGSGGDGTAKTRKVFV